VLVYNWLYLVIFFHIFRIFLESLGSNGASTNEDAKTWISP
jgi:hypothetical protein